MVEVADEDSINIIDIEKGGSHLRDESGGSVAEDEIKKISKQLSDRIYSDPHLLEILKRSINMDALMPHLINKGIISLSVSQSFDNKRSTNKDRVEQLISILHGPTAIYRLVQCLQDEKCHVTHRQFLKHLSPDAYNGPLDSMPYPAPMDKTRKRKRESNEETSEVCQVPVSKRQLCLIKPDGTLGTDHYCMKMAKIQEHHYYSKWREADKIVEDCRYINEELFIAAKLRNYSCHVANSHVSRETIADDIQNNILQWCSRSYSNNCKFLESKCHWVLAKGARYAKEWGEAEQHITAAMEFHHSFEPGEDVGCSSYCKASILNQTLATNYSKELYLEVKKLYRKAIDNVKRNELSYGLPICQPVIRLAQMCLYSTPHKAGTCDDEEQIKEAKELLDGIEAQTMLLKPRIACLYYIAKCDLYRNMHDNEKAECFARQAEVIAYEGKFSADIDTVNVRLAALDLTKREFTSNFDLSKH